MTVDAFQHDCVLVCNGLPNSISNGLSLEEHEPINLENAKKDHQVYLDFLKQSGLKVIEISPNENYPDCVFVEDVVIAIKNRLFLGNLLAKSRNGETDIVKAQLEKVASDLKLELVYSKNSDAFIDGGDVCFTGKEIFVGLSTRTNLKGAQELQQAFPNIPVITCEVKKGLHLKSSMTMFDEKTIIVGTSEASQFIKKQIMEKSQFVYKFIEIDDEKYAGSANVLYFNKKLAVPSHLLSIYEKFPEFQAIKEVKGLPNAELFKIDGCLTCRSVFFSRGK